MGYYKFKEDFLIYIYKGRIIYTYTLQNYFLWRFFFIAAASFWLFSALINKDIASGLSILNLEITVSEKTKF